MQVLFITQSGQEDLDEFNQRVNAALEELGGSVTDIRMSACLHQKRIGERANIPWVMLTIMILYEGSA